MPWKVASVETIRREFVELASKEGANRSELCRRFGISRKTGYKWLARYEASGGSGLEDRSRRPVSSPGRTSEEMESVVLAAHREMNRSWGGRKLRQLLLDRGVSGVPAASTITEILRRHGELSPREESTLGPYQRFERERPNELWQMDFKGHFGLADGTRCHPLTMLDDHSRFSLVIEAFGNERGETVRGALTAAFRVYGLPEAMLMDNGAPWGNDRESPWTPLTVWLLRLGVQVLHGRPSHPQTQGKLERFHQSLKAEVLQGGPLRDLQQSQERFDRWRSVYNFERPHESLGMRPPGERYEASARRYPEEVPPLEFSPIDEIRKVQRRGEFHFQGQQWYVSQAFSGEHVGLRPTLVDGVWEVWFGRVWLGELDQSISGERRRVVRRRPRGLNEGSGGGTDCGRCDPSVRSTPETEEEDVLPMSPDTCYP
ncbi:Integrase core domain protein [Planctomycetes bacterium Pan216]|uniref:Integrase core domain protein n=1 Tax=Kolteria novifilia TaxID=2527975 RepID=A0A518AXJ8_9BACT|nr:Integrase core domain protein [Planctomycetes bacterium Pan216]QDU64220.1 Integrase core domain protein [Planctomycetes bacterium Pan216]QDU64848.1 Integrase core domain protein [Planctomycetes bacterium Pan216]